jgi:hypothetical protein
VRQQINAEIHNKVDTFGLIEACDVGVNQKDENTLDKD